jgi:hypothetical protein
MTTLGQFEVDFQGTEASQMFLEPVFMDESIRSQFRIMPNVPNKKKMGFVSQLENIVRKYTGCGFTPIGQLNIYEREIDVTKASADIELCWDEFQDTVLEEALKTGTQIADLTGTILQDILLRRVREGIMLDVERLAYFGNIKSVSPNFNIVDGLWTVYYPDLVTKDLVPRTDTGSGSDIAAGFGVEILRMVYEQAFNTLKGLPNDQKFFNVTGSVYEALIRDYENSGGGDFGFGLLRDGQNNLTYRGIRVIPQWRWDTILTGLGVTKPNYVEYTTNLNKALATDVLDPSTQLESWYDKKDEKLYTKARWKMGVNYVHPSLISLGY